MRRALPLLIALLAGCGTKMVPVQPELVLLDRPQPSEAIRAAIIRGVTRHRLTTDSEKPGRIVATYDRRGVMYRFAFEYTDRQYVIRYLETRGLETASSRDGMLIEMRYPRMIKRLQRAINEEISRPAREAAEGRARARQHELAVEAERRRAEEARLERERLQRQPPPASPPPPPIHVHAPPPDHHRHPVQIQHRDVRKSGSQTLTCCINGARYTCPSQQAFNQCMSLSPSACTPAGRCK